MMKIKVGLLLAGIVLIFTGCQKKEIQYQTIEVVKKDLVKKVEVNGAVETLNTVDIFAPVSGRLEKFYVKEGDMVSAKQKIGTISSENRSMIIDMAAAKGKAEVEYWKSQLLLTPVYAPVAGKIIVLKASNTGERVSGSIGEISTGEIIRANVDENDLLGVAVGKRVDIRFDIDPKKILKGTLEKISQTSKTVNNVNVYPVEISLPDQEQRKKTGFDIKIGMSVTLTFSVHEIKDAKALPTSAVNGKASGTVQVLREDGTKAKVKLGEVYEDFVEVISGLEIGDKIKIPAFKGGKTKVRKSPLMLKKK